MTQSVSKRLHDLPVSSVRKLIPYAVEAEKHGVKVYRLNMGEPDLKSPQVMLDALKTFDANPICYAPSGGTKEYINALQTYYNQLGSAHIDAHHIIGTTAGSESINMALFGACDPGDGVLVFEPFYSAYATAAKMWGIELQPISTQIATGFHLPPTDRIEKAIKSNTRAILFANPNNPTGTVLTRDEVEMLVRISKKYNLYLISDEVYREFVFVDRAHVSILSYMDEIPDLAILVDSLSKRYSICGARLGALVSKNSELMNGALKFAMSRLSGGLVDQHIGAQLVNVPQSYTDTLKREFQKRRDVVFQKLKEIPGLQIALPEGAFYIFTKLPVPDAQAFCIWMLESYRQNNETVFLTPGNGFYYDPENGKSYVRIAYVINEPELIHALDIVKEGLEQYKIKGV